VLLEGFYVNEKLTQAGIEPATFRFPTLVPHNILKNSFCIFMSAADTLKRKSRRRKLKFDTLINSCYLTIISRHVNCGLLIL